MGHEGSLPRIEQHIFVRDLVALRSLGNREQLRLVSLVAPVDGWCIVVVVGTYILNIGGARHAEHATLHAAEHSKV